MLHIVKFTSLFKQSVGSTFKKFYNIDEQRKKKLNAFAIRIEIKVFLYVDRDREWSGTF